MIWKSDQNCSELISNPDTDQCWSEKNTQNWSALISNCDAAQRWSEHVGGGKVLPNSGKSFSTDPRPEGIFMGLDRASKTGTESH